ncbi:DUF803-domain-containing protein [Xylariomycetidae sp. FL0641]|nr:DUF803-domain-containing protein [Xylariomycetidae sp. FL0641]
MPVLPGSIFDEELRVLVDPVSSGKGDESRLGNWSSFIGIVTAIVGNILIALALNVQRYSHLQLHRRRAEARERAKEAMKRVGNGHRNGYGTTATTSPGAGSTEARRDADANPLETHPLTHSFQSGDSASTESSPDGAKVVSTYLKSPSWWLGQVLMTVGEMGNFLAYGFAPASIVSPLGVVALISNCVIAPLFFGEVFRKRDFWGVVIAVGGAVTVVLSANTEETKMDPHDVWDAITTMAFEIYMGVTIFLIVLLMWASPKYGNRTILIDLGLVGLFGGYTALTTKGVSSMLSSTLFRAFTTPVTYGMLFVLLGTAIMQVRYVNKALQRFDSTQVIPIQFVLFTLSVIIGSAVLYRDFERTNARQAAKFIGGCLLTFFGVFLITTGRPPQEDDDELSDDENVEETIGLRHQENPGAYSGNPDQQQAVSASPSRRSSRVSRAALGPAGLNFLSSQDGNGIPATRKPDGSASRISLPTPAEERPLLNNPWASPKDDGPTHPGLPPTLSVDSVPTIHSLVSTAMSEPLESPSPLPHSVVPIPTPDSPRTPRGSLSLSRPPSHHYSNAFISPSPLSSTVSAVVSDALRRGPDSSPTGRRRSLRRMRPGIRSSLFVSQDELGDISAAEPLPQPSDEMEHPPQLDGSQAGSHQTVRGRARSLSNTLGGLFGRKGKRRRNSDPEGGESPGGRRAEPPGAE